MTTGDRRPLGPGDLGRTRRRPSFDRSLQRTMLTQLLLGTLAFAVLLVGAVYIGYVRPQLRRSPAAVRPVIEAYLAAGAEGDLLAAHRLFSSAGIRSVSRDDLAVRFVEHDLYDGYAGLEFTSFTLTPDGGPFGNPLAHTTAVVRYTDAPPADLVAELEREDDAWRLRSIDISRPPPTP